MDGRVGRGRAAAVLAAACFGATAPLSKQLLGHAGVTALSFLLYAGAFGAITSMGVVRGRSPEPSLERTSVVAVVLLAASGGVVAPLLLLFGLHRTTGVAGSLLLNLEGPLTLLLAVGVFGEHLQARFVVAAGAVFAGAAFVTADPGRSDAAVAGALAIVAACAVWAVDNNVTQRLSARDPVRIAQLKTGTAAAALGVISVATGSRFPHDRFLAEALVVGAIGYGISIVLDVHALRALGAARESVFFASAPFVGAVVAIPLLSEHVTLGIAVGALLMLAGVVAFVRERHEHRHVHAAVDHEHLHRHDDDHHGHRHDEVPDGGHSHPHHHAPTEHAHAHVSDAHHRHGHQ